MSELETAASPELASALSSIGEGRLMSDESNLDLVSCAVAKVTHDSVEMRGMRFFMSKIEIYQTGGRIFGFIKECNAQKIFTVL